MLFYKVIFYNGLLHNWIIHFFMWPGKQMVLVVNYGHFKCEFTCTKAIIFYSNSRERCQSYQDWRRSLLAKCFVAVFNASCFMPLPSWKEYWLMTLKSIELHLKFQIAWHPYLHFSWVRPIVAFLWKLWFDTVGFFLKTVGTCAA